MIKPSDLPSVDRLLTQPATVALVAQYGRTFTADVLRALLAETRELARADNDIAIESIAPDRLLGVLSDRLQRASSAKIRRVFNLTGVVLHTNLGRAVMAEEAITAAIEAMRHPATVEFDLEGGGRGDRDDAVLELIREMTGAEAATVVNNNAAAVLLSLNTLAARKEAIVSRGELIEIGGAFRIPDVMTRAGCKLREVGTTNRTHLRDFEEAIGPQTAMLLKVHTSNYAVVGFTSAVDVAELAPVSRAHGLVLMEDLGSGTLVNLEQWGLPHERTPGEAIEAGADIVTFSGDKLLGGPQCGLIVGKRELIAKIRKNPLKRALRVDKVTLAALAATLQLYRDPERLVERLPTIRMLARSAANIGEQAERLAPLIRARLGDQHAISVREAASQIGSGSRPLDLLPSRAIAIEVNGPKKGAGTRIAVVERMFRSLPIPVIGRIERDALLLDLRCLDDEPAFIAQLEHIHPISSRRQHEQ
ncbi:MAG: L-seryl-tRNA(Sec) selenium transferase [Betaproteobacteria bacterium]|nr:L-seryl-tRNA(Sec) selenium transferase [Betaproteobacteria bacterium]